MFVFILIEVMEHFSEAHVDFSFVICNYNQKSTLSVLLFFLVFSNYYLSHVLFIFLLIICWRIFSISDFFKRQDEDCLSLFIMHLEILTFSLSHTLLESRTVCTTSLPISSDGQAFLSWKSTILIVEKNPSYTYIAWKWHLAQI